MIGESREILGPDGRWLSVWVGGEGEEFVLIHAGTPETGRLHDFDVEVAAEHGFTCVGYSRPGYANSDRHPGRRIADCAADVRAIADVLGIGSFVTVGRSGGGGHALACASLLPDRIRAAAVVGASAPRRADGFDWYADMATMNRDEFSAAEAGDDALRRHLEVEEGKWKSATPADVPALFGDLLADGVAEKMTQEAKEFSLECMQGALATGIWGWFDDDMAWIGDWGFDLAEIAVPVSIWHAEADTFVPLPHAEWMAENVPGATLHIHSAEEHMSLPKSTFGEMLERLREAARS